MKTNDDKVIVYDDKCPMCAMYTAGFIRWGIMKKNDRISFSELDCQAFMAGMDPELSRDEIPLVDLNGGKTIYGLDAMLYLLDRKIPFLVRVARMQPFYWFFRRLYKLVSFNRRVIVGGRNHASRFDCTPHFNYKYRLTFVVFAAALASLLSYFFGTAIAAANPGLDFPFPAGWFSVAACGTGWLLHQATAAAVMKKDRALDYAGHLATLQIMGVAPLLLTILLGRLPSAVVNASAAVAVLVSMALMYTQHRRRMKNNDWRAAWTAAWAGTLLLSIGSFIFFIR